MVVWRAKEGLFLGFNFLRKTGSKRKEGGKMERGDGGSCFIIVRFLWRQRGEMVWGSRAVHMWPPLEFMVPSLPLALSEDVRSETQFFGPCNHIFFHQRGSQSGTVPVSQLGKRTAPVRLLQTQGGAGCNGLSRMRVHTRTRTHIFHSVRGTLVDFLENCVCTDRPSSTGHCLQVTQHQ